MQVVHKQKSQVIDLNASTETITKKNPVLHTTIESMNIYRHTALQI
ncbi:MAG: hypothetical protein ACTHXJ_02285 [Mesonia sp.]